MRARTSVSRAAALFAAVSFAGSVAVAQRINVNLLEINPSPGDPDDPAELVGPAGGSGETWNQTHAPSAVSNLLDATGDATSVGFTHTYSHGFRNNSPDLRLLRASRSMFGKGVNATVTITGLVANEYYDVWIASHIHNSSPTEPALGEWSTTNPTITIGPQMIDGRGTLNGATWVRGQNYVRFDRVQANASGEIAFLADAANEEDYGGAGEHRLPLNGFQIEVSGELIGGPVDPDVSTVVATPLTVVANGVATATVTVTLMDEENIPIANKQVTLANTSGPQQATIAPVTAQTTDDYGKATFAVSSATVGTEVFTATNVTDDDMLITQTASVEFIAPRGLFSVNFFGYGGGDWSQESWRKTVRMDGVKSGGVWETAAWTDIGPTFPGWTGTTPMVWTITAEDDASTATLTVTHNRNQSPYLWTSTRHSATWDDGNASLLDAKIVGTYDLRANPDDPQDRRVKFEISDIPYAAYDLAIYFAINQGQWGWNAPGGQANLRHNEQIDGDPEGVTGGIQFFISHVNPQQNVEPDGTLRQIIDDGDVGNYIILEGLSGNFRGEVWGQSLNHAGPSGFQIKEVILPPTGTLITVR